jgi:hypothetical protein
LEAVCEELYATWNTNGKLERPEGFGEVGEVVEKATSKSSTKDLSKVGTNADGAKFGSIIGIFM